MTPTDALIRRAELLRAAIDTQVPAGASYQIRVWAKDGTIRVQVSVKNQGR
jgi:hypothetical protein